MDEEISSLLAKQEAELQDREFKRGEDKQKMLQDIAQQLRDKEALKQQQYEEFLKEKKMIDDIVTKIHEEDQKYLIS